MVKRSDVVLLGLLVLLFLAAASWPYSSYKMGSSTGAVVGNPIGNSINKFYDMDSINQRLFVLSQVVLLIIIAVAAFFIIKRFKSKEKLFKKNYVVSGVEKRSRTDLDVLYEMLKQRKIVDLEDIEKVFQVSSEVAFEWSKILENGNLAEIDYPRFGKPVLKLAEGKVIIKGKNSKIKDDEKKGIKAKAVVEKVPTKKVKVSVPLTKKKIAKTKRMNKSASKKKKVTK